MFFDARSRAALEIPSLEVLAIDAHPLLTQFRDRVAGTALCARTVFTGEVFEVLPGLWNMDVGCLAPGSNEGFSNAVIEQMAAGRPMAVTGVGGNAEAVVNGGERLRGTSARSRAGRPMRSVPSRWMVGTDSGRDYGSVHGRG